MRTFRSSSAFDLFDRLEKQLNQQLSQQLAQPLPAADPGPAAEVNETAEAYLVVLELPGVDKTVIDVQASDRSLLITAQRRRPDQEAAAQPSLEAAVPALQQPGTSPQADLWAEKEAFGAERSALDQRHSPEAAADSEPAVASGSPRRRPAAPLLSEFRYGTLTRRFRFPLPIQREQLRAVYRDGLLTVTVPKAPSISTVSVTVES